MARGVGEERKGGQGNGVTTSSLPDTPPTGRELDYALTGRSDTRVGDPLVYSRPWGRGRASEDRTRLVPDGRSRVVDGGGKTGRRIFSESSRV